MWRATVQNGAAGDSSPEVRALPHYLRVHNTLASVHSTLVCTVGVPNALAGVHNTRVFTVGVHNALAGVHNTRVCTAGVPGALHRRTCLSLFADTIVAI